MAFLRLRTVEGTFGWTGFGSGGSRSDAWGFRVFAEGSRSILGIQGIWDPSIPMELNTLR